MSSNLPPGCTDVICEPNDPECENCGHKFSEHYENEDIKKEMTSDIVLACDRLIFELGEKVQCKCKKFIEGKFCPDG
jgi:hypothetical protein